MNKALIVIDVQVGMFLEEDPVFAGELLLERIQGLIEKARTCAVPVIYVQHNEDEGEQLATNSPDWQIHPLITPEAGDAIVQKFTPNSFHETDLQSILSAKGINHLIIAGLQTDVCVNATSRCANELGYQVTIVQDAHSTWGQGDLSAQQIIDQYNEQFARFASLEESTKIDF